MRPIVRVRRRLSTGGHAAERILSAAGPSNQCPADLRDWFTERPDLTITSARGECPPPRATRDARETRMASKNVQEFTTENWQTEVAQSGQPVLVDFWAPWCGPCRALTPIIDKIADQFAGRVKVGKVNVDENSDLAIKYDVTTIPRVLIFKGSDQPLQQVVGLTPEAELVKMLDKALAS